MNLDTLKSLQARIRNATGPDREIDLEICKAFGRAPIDAIWDVDENLPPDLAKLYKRGWTTPAYVKRRQEYKRGVDEAFSARLTPDETMTRIRSLQHEWDFKNAPPFGLCSTYTASLDACVALQSEVLLGWAWKVGTCCVSDDAWVVPDFNCPVHGERLSKELGTIEWGSIWDTGIDIDRRPPGNVPLALLEGIFAAVIAREEAQETEKT